MRQDEMGGGGMLLIDEGEICSGLCHDDAAALNLNIDLIHERSVQ
jgi:hypothetical protein